MKIFYITRARIPSEKAHAFQIVTMCKTFLEMGNEIMLVLPKRKNSIKNNITEYYGFETDLKVKYLKATPVIFNRYFGKITFWLEGLTFSFRSLFLTFTKDSIIFTRSIEVALIHSLFRKKVIFEIHDWPHSLVFVYVFMLKRIPYIVVTAKGLAEELDNNYITRYQIAPNGVGEEYFNKSFDLEVTRQAFEISESMKILMYVGALSNWKGVTTLLEAATFLDKEKYLIVVAGGSLTEISSLKILYPDVKFVGYVPNNILPTFQRLADILIVPNRSDSPVSAKYTSPLKLIAHMASERPIIVSDLPSTRALVNDDEVFFFDGSTVDLCRVVEYIERHPDVAYGKVKKAFEKSKSMTWRNRAQLILRFVKT